MLSHALVPGRSLALCRDQLTEPRPCLEAPPAAQMPSLRDKGVSTATQSGGFSLPPDTAASPFRAQTALPLGP